MLKLGNQNTIKRLTQSLSIEIKLTPSVSNEVFDKRIKHPVFIDKTEVVEVVGRSCILSRRGENES